MFIFTLRSYPTLDRYWNKTRTPAQLQVHPTIDKRLDALMKERQVNCFLVVSFLPMDRVALANQSDMCNKTILMRIQKHIEIPNHISDRLT